MQHFELEAREAVRELVARYNQYGDAGRIDALLELFCEDAVLEILKADRDDAAVRSGQPAPSARKSIARYAGKGRIRELFTESRYPKSQMLRHFIATHQIDIESEHAASGRCYYVVLDEQGIDHFGRYRDRYRRSAAGWRFAARKVYVDMVRAGGYAEHNLQHLAQTTPSQEP